MVKYGLVTAKRLDFLMVTNRKNSLNNKICFKTHIKWANGQKKKTVIW